MMQERKPGFVEEKLSFSEMAVQFLAVGHKSRRLYQMAVHARITAEQSNVAEDSQNTWDSWPSKTWALEYYRTSAFGKGWTCRRTYH